MPFVLSLSKHERPAAGHSLTPFVMPAQAGIHVFFLFAASNRTRCYYSYEQEAPL